MAAIKGRVVEKPANEMAETVIALITSYGSDMIRALKERFDADGLSIPFPQRDVHLHQSRD